MSTLVWRELVGARRDQWLREQVGRSIEHVVETHFVLSRPRLWPFVPKGSPHWVRLVCRSLGLEQWSSGTDYLDALDRALGRFSRHAARHRQREIES